MRSRKLLGKPTAFLVRRRGAGHPAQRSTAAIFRASCSSSTTLANSDALRSKARPRLNASTVAVLRQMVDVTQTGRASCGCHQSRLQILTVLMVAAGARPVEPAGLSRRPSRRRPSPVGVMAPPGQTIRKDTWFVHWQIFKLTGRTAADGRRWKLKRK